MCSEGCSKDERESSDDAWEIGFGPAPNPSELRLGGQGWGTSRG